MNIPSVQDVNDIYKKNWDESCQLNVALKIIGNFCECIALQDAMNIRNVHIRLYYLIHTNLEDYIKFRRVEEEEKAAEEEPANDA
jgi:hypothetical protein